MLQHRLADIVPVEPVALACMGGRERRTIRAVEQPFQQCGRIGAGAGGALARMIAEDYEQLVRR